MTPPARDPRLVNDHPLVSVAILNYNYARFLRQCIDSVLAQDYAAIQILVVDDGSTDDSRAVIESYRRRIEACFKPNGGMVSSMNRAFALSRGDIVVFLDADDFLLPDAVSAHVAAHAGGGVVRSQTSMRLLQGGQLIAGQIPGVRAEDGDLRERVLRRGPGAYVSSPNSGNAWSRDFLSEVMPLPEEPRSIGAETYLMDAAPLFGMVVTIAHPPRAAYRLHDANMNGALVTMTPQNIRKIIGHHEARIAWLAGVARSRGLVPHEHEWQARNWRLLTLQYLDRRMTGRSRVPFLGHVRPTLSIPGNIVKRHVLALAVVCIRWSPMALSMYLAGRLIKLRYM